MAAAYLHSISASAPAQFCSNVPFVSRRNALAVLKRGNLKTCGEVFKCDACPCWHIRPNSHKGQQAK